MANPNQFNQTSVRGRVATQNAENIYNVKIDDSVTANVLSGDAMVLSTTAGKQTIVKPAENSTDAIYGFRVYDIIKDTRTGGDEAKVACDNVEMDMVASASIARGATVEYNPTTGKIVTKSTGTSVGIAQEPASADGDLIRVLIKIPSLA
jgi:hypothetical protein